MTNKWIRIALTGLVAVAATASYAAGRITGVSVQKVGKGVQVLIQGSELGRPKAEFLNTATQYTLEFNATLSLKGDKLNVWQNGLETIQPIFNGGKTLLKFKFDEPINAVVTTDKKGVSVVFEPAELLLLSMLEPTPKAVAKAVVKPTAIAKSSSKSIPNTPPTVKAPVEYLTASLNQPKVRIDNIPAFRTRSTPTAVPTTLPAIRNFGPQLPKQTKQSSAPTPTIPPIKTTIAAQPFKIASTKPVVPGVSGEDLRVSLDFVNTQIVNIVKSLALQTRVNIVTSPDVTGKLSVKLDKVTVKEALTLVTSLAGLKYAQVGRTYIVTTESKFLETLRAVQGPREETVMSRVVPVFSGQTLQIKLAVLKSVSSENAFGRFELVLPSERVSMTPAATDKEPKAAGGLVGEGDPYMMLIGSPGRLDEVENLVRAIDRQLCTALGVKPPKTVDSVVRSYTVHGGRAVDLIEALAGKGKTNVGNVECFATPTSSISKQTIVLKGFADEVDQVIAAFQELDSDEAATMTEFQVYDLKFSDPRAVREALISNIPGLSVVIAPNAVLNPKVYQEDRLRNQAEQRGTDTPAPQGGGTPMASGQGQQGQQQQGQGGQQQQLKTDKSDANSGLILPFDDYESVGMPMRLIMKGSRDQVERATQLIQQFDVAPRQVSLEMRVMEVSREELLRVGIDWNLFTSGALKTIRLNNPTTGSNNRIGVSVQGSDVSGDVSAILDSISNGSRLISRPNMICNDGRSNEVFVGDVIRYIESIISGQNGPSVTQGTVSTGVRLAAFPRLGGDGTINLDLRTKVVYLKGWEVVSQIGGRLPQTSERTAQNSITLKDGETFAIGGLIQQEDRKSMTGLPILKDLPIFGQFFRSTQTDKVKTELVIFVTAKMINVGQAKSLPMEKDTSLNHDGSFKKGHALVNTESPIKVGKKGGSI
jgi:type II secretory pathway component GspD/PulD (secretin)